MARYEVFANPFGPGFVLDVQADTLDDFGTRVVVPLLPSGDVPRNVPRLNPAVVVDGQPLVMATQFLTAIKAGLLGRPVASLAPQHAEIMAALDVLLTGV